MCMSLYQASFRLRHECPYRELSEQFSDLTIREWYLSDCQVLEISSQNAPYDDLLKEIDQLGTILHRSSSESGLHIVTQAASVRSRIQSYPDSKPLTVFTSRQQFIGMAGRNTT